LETEFEAQKKALGGEATMERAVKLRELLKNRATIYEMIDEPDRAEAEYNALLNIKPLNPMVYLDRGSPRLCKIS
jgi:hypothetical protein